MDDGPSYPKPFVVEPRREHKQSLILLHGRGSNGEKFGIELLASRTTLMIRELNEESGSAILASVFPEAKFIFPTARKRRAKWYNRATINQWFDNVPIDEQDAGMSKEEEEWQLEGLRQSRAYLKLIVEEEVKLVGAANVFIGGLSQGCAMSLHLLLSYEESPSLGGFVGMSGWLPFVDVMESIIRPKNSREDDENEDDENEDDDDDDDPFATSGGEELYLEDEESDLKSARTGPPSVVAKVCNLVRDNMDLPPSRTQPSWLSTPIFLGHEKSDDKVNMSHGLRASKCLRDCGVQVTWAEYDEGHWYKVPEEIDDIIEFLQACLSRPRV